MGVWIAAARLGLGLAGKNRRCRTTIAAAAANLGRTKWEEKSIYLCFNELFEEEEEGNHVVRRISLHSVTNNHKEEEEELLKMEAYKMSKFMDDYRSSCICTLGSKIIIPYNDNPEPKRQHICWIDTSKPRLKFQVSSQIDLFNTKIRSFDKIKNFEKCKYELKLGEIDGKLYCINKGMEKKNGKSFEVFNSPRWLPLSAPPFIKFVQSWYNYDAVFLNESKKILGWKLNAPDSSSDQVYCFDVMNSEKGWIKLDDPVMLNIVPSLYKPLFVHGSHPDLGDFYLVFRYDPHEEPLCISAYFMSNKFNSFQPIDQLIQLPELCSHYLEESGDDARFSAAATQFALVNLGPQKVGLVINKYARKKAEGIVLLVTFEYDMIVNVEEDKIEMNTRLLGTHRFRYETIRKPDQPARPVSDTDLIGAFLL